MYAFIGDMQQQQQQQASNKWTEEDEIIIKSSSLFKYKVLNVRDVNSTQVANVEKFKLFHS